MEDMCSYTLETGTEDRDTGEKDKNGQAITETVSVLYVKVHLKTYSDMVAEYGFGEDEVAMLEELMRPENLALLGGNGADSFESLRKKRSGQLLAMLPVMWEQLCPTHLVRWATHTVRSCGTAVITTTVALWSIMRGRQPEWISASAAPTRRRPRPRDWNRPERASRWKNCSPAI